MSEKASLMGFLGQRNARPPVPGEGTGALFQLFSRPNQEKSGIPFQESPVDPVVEDGGDGGAVGGRQLGQELVCEA